MKHRHSIGIAAISLSIGFAAAAGIVHHNHEDIIEAKAETSSAASGLLIGINNDAHNFAQGCTIAVEYYGATHRTVKVDKIGDYLYSATLPAGTTGFNIYRLNPSEDAYLPYDTAPSEDKEIRYNVFNYTYDSTKNMVVFDYENFSKHDYTTSSYTVVPAGTKYAYHHDQTSWIGDWFQADASPRLVTFAVDYYGADKQFIEMERIGDTQYMEVTLNKTLCLDKYYYARLNPKAEVGDGAVWSQTTDITINKSGGLVMGLTTGTDGKVNWKGTTEDEDYAEKWGAVFLSKVTCSGSGSVDNTADWTATKQEYQGMSAAQQGLVWTAVGNPEGSTYLARAIYRYDYIVLYKKALGGDAYASYDDYVNRAESVNKTDSFNAAPLLPVTQNGTGLPSPVIAFAAVTLICVTIFIGYAYYRKHHSAE